MVLLESIALNVRFGGLQAIRRLDLQVGFGEIKGIIGPNGAGKTTLFNTLTGFTKPYSGVIRFGGDDIVGLDRHQIARKGMLRTFQNIRLFKEMTVLENVMVGYHTRSTAEFLGALFRPRWVKEEEKRAREVSHEILNVLQLSDKADDVADALPHGKQKLLEIGRALAAQPRILLLDEPGAGLTADEIKNLATLLRNVRESKITLVVIEHNMDMVMSLCDSVAVLNFGEKIAEGKPKEIQENEKVIEAYLGK